ncbi:hypothetical protein MCEMSHM24_02432 [Comamonadaceae bacterium]
MTTAAKDAFAGLNPGSDTDLLSSMDLSSLDEPKETIPDFDQTVVDEEFSLANVFPEDLGPLEVDLEVAATPVEGEPEKSSEAPQAAPRFSPKVEHLMSMRRSEVDGQNREQAGDPIQEAAVEVFRRRGFPITHDDDTYAVMEFMGLALTNLEKDLSGQRRVELDESINRLLAIGEQIDGSAAAFKNDFQKLETALSAAHETHIKQTVAFLKSAFALAEKQLSEHIKKVEAQAETSFNEKLRQQVTHEVQLGISKGFANELALMQASVNAMNSSFQRVQGEKKKRSGEGVLARLWADFTDLTPGQQLLVGAGVLSIFVSVVF